MGLRDTVDALLLRKSDFLSILDGLHAFHGRSGGESPARATSSLVLDGEHLACCDPVDVLSVVQSAAFAILVEQLSACLISWHVGTSPLRELFICQVAHFVLGEADTDVVLVEPIDLLFILCVDLETESQIINTPDIPIVGCCGTQEVSFGLFTASG